MSQSEEAPVRRLRLVLRDHRVLEADARVPPGQSLAAFLASRARYVYLTGVDWLGTGERMPDVALKIDTILWAFDEAEEPPATRSVAARPVDVEVEGGYLLGAGLALTEGQRLSEFLQSAPAFIPLRGAELMPRGKTLGDIVVNHHVIQVVRERPGGDADREAPAT